MPRGLRLAKKKGYPKKVYIRRDPDWDDDLSAKESAADHAQKDTSVEVAVYQFVEMVRVSNISTVLPLYNVKGRPER